MEKKHEQPHDEIYGKQAQIGKCKEIKKRNRKTDTDIKDEREIKGKRTL